MNWQRLADGARGVNLAALQLWLTRREEAAPYVSACVQLCDSLLRRGLRRMMRPEGLVFWHDYGGKGRFRGITTYLHELADRFPVYRVPGTTMAWAPAAGVRSLMMPFDRAAALV